MKKKLLKYRYVLALAKKCKGGYMQWCIGAKDLDALTSLICCAASDKKNPTFRALTKSQADKFKLRPEIACSGRD